MAKSLGTPGFSYKPEHPDQTPPMLADLADIPVPKGYKIKPMTPAERKTLAEIQKAQQAKK